MPFISIVKISSQGGSASRFDSNIRQIPITPALGPSWPQRRTSDLSSSIGQIVAIGANGLGGAVW
jgi:hypothetical protein